MLSSKDPRRWRWRLERELWKHTYTQGVNATLERKREKRTKGVAHLLIQRTNL
jgi:hypothetical protein